MAARTQRVEKLIKEFMQYHEEGYSILDIAKIFNVDISTVYNNLQEIADSNNVSRESLLERKSSTHDNPHMPFFKEKIDAKRLQQDFMRVENDLDYVIEEIDTILLTTKE